MIDYLIDSEEDITLLTCKECALDIYRDLLEADCEFAQSGVKILKELNGDSEVYEITKLVAEGYEEDIYFIFAMEDEKFLRDRNIIIDSCVDEYVDKDKIPSSANVIYIEDEEFEDDLCAISSFVKLFLNIEDKNTDEEEDNCICDECLAVSEIMNMKIESLEESLREAYRFGREAALIEIMENINSTLYTKI